MFRKYSFEASIASVLFIALFFDILLQILGRTSLVPGPIWTEELARWIWVWMALIGIAAVERNGAHLKMGFLTDFLPKSIQKGLAIVTDAIYLGLLVHLVWIAYKTILRTSNNESVTLPTVDATLYASVFVALILIVHRVARRLYTTLFSATSNDEAKS